MSKQAPPVASLPPHPPTHTGGLAQQSRLVVDGKSGQGVRFLTVQAKPPEGRLPEPWMLSR